MKTVEISGNNMTMMADDIRDFTHTEWRQAEDWMYSHDGDSEHTYDLDTHCDGLPVKVKIGWFVKQANLMVKIGTGATYVDVQDFDCFPILVKSHSNNVTSVVFGELEFDLLKDRIEVTRL